MVCMEGASNALSIDNQTIALYVACEGITFASQFLFLHRASAELAEPDVPRASNRMSGNKTPSLSSSDVAQGTFNFPGTRLQLRLTSTFMRPSLKASLTRTELHEFC